MRERCPFALQCHPRGTETGLWSIFTTFLEHLYYTPRQRAVYSGRVAPERGRRRDEMKAISGSHALLTNIVLAWNTSRMDEVVERLKRDGTLVEDDWLRRIGPAHFSHINFRGTMRFGGEKCAEALVQRGPRYPARVAS